MTERDKWIFDKISNPLKDKDYLIKHTVINMLNKTTRMFRYKNLPKTIAVKDLELQLQVGGHCVWKKVKDELYTFRSGLGGAPNPYYLPTIATVANPALNFTENLKIDENCVVMLNDNLYEGVLPILSKYASLQVEGEISLRYALLNARIPALVQADNDNTYDSATALFDKIVKGDDYGVVASKEFFDGLRSHEFTKRSNITDIIEAIQYVKGSCYNEIGLNAAFNMKREAINEAEATLNEDILYPLIDNMLENRKIGLEKVNAMYNTEIEVELDSVWKNNRKIESLSIEQKEAEIEEIKGGTE